MLPRCCAVATNGSLIAARKDYRASQKSAAPWEIPQHAIRRVCAGKIHHIREGKHGARSTKQAIAIGVSKARRAGVDLPPPKKGRVSEKTRRSAARAYAKGRRGNNETAPRRSRATERALKREGTQRGVKKSTLQASALRSTTPAESRAIGFSPTSCKNKRPTRTFP